MAQTLEEQLKKSEARRQRVEQDRQLLAKGEPLPGSKEDLRRKVENVADTVRQMLKAEAFDEVLKLLEVLKSPAEIIEALQDYNIKVDSATNVMNRILATVEKEYGLMQDVVKQITVDLDERRKLRDEQRQTLSLLNQYLRNWL